MLNSVKLFRKYVIIIYALGSNQSRSKVVPKAKFPARLGEKNG